MISDEIKNKFLKELEKYGNVWASCLKLNIHRSTYYRWKETDKEFVKKASKAVRQGRENISDVSEHALLQNIKEKKMDAIKYALSHNSSRYKQRTQKVVIEHSNKFKELQFKVTNEEQKKLDEMTEDLKQLTERIIKSPESNN